MEKIRIVELTVLVAASLFLPLQGRAADTPAEAGLERLMQDKLEVSGKAGALKQKLTKNNPEALKRYKEILTLRARIERLNAEIDAILKKQSAQYRHLLREKQQLSRRYREARDAATGRGD